MSFSPQVNFVVINGLALWHHISWNDLARRLGYVRWPPCQWFYHKENKTRTIRCSSSPEVEDFNHQESPLAQLDSSISWRTLGAHFSIKILQRNWLRTLRLQNPLNECLNPCIFVTYAWTYIGHEGWTRWPNCGTSLSLAEQSFLSFPRINSNETIP